MLTEKEGAKDSGTLVPEVGVGNEELSVGAAAGELSQAVRIMPMVRIVITRGAVGSKLIAFPPSPLRTGGPLPAAPDGLGL